jgi:hypothetical protein
MNTSLKRKLLILGSCIAVGVVTAVIMASKKPDIYEAVSTISVPVFQGNAQLAFNDRQPFREELEGYHEIQISYLMSSKVMNRVHEKLREFAPKDSNFKMNYRVKRSPGSFKLLVESSDQDYAKKFVTIWAREFLNFKEEIADNALGNKVSFIRQEIAAKERELAKAQTEPKGELSDATKQALAKAFESYQKVSMTHQAARLKVKELEVNLATSDRTAANSIKEQVELARIEEQGLQSVLKENERTISDLASIGREPGPEVDNVKLSLTELRRELRTLENVNNHSALSILEEGIGSPNPVGPNRGKILLLGAIAGGFLGCIGMGFISLTGRNRIQ